MENPNTIYLPMKISPATKAAAEDYAKEEKISGLSTAVRHAAESELRRRGKLNG